MRLLQLYNEYRSLFGGEDKVIQMIASLVEKHGGQSRLLLRSSRGLDKSLRLKLRAFFSGFYNYGAIREVHQVIEAYKPDVVHAHNLYPLFSPSALVACRRAGIPVVVSFHNFTMTCPNTSHLCRGQICERCAGGREIQCVLKNCRGHLSESATYASRFYFERKMGMFKKNADLFISLTRFAKKKLITTGIEPSRIRVLPNMADLGVPVTDPAAGGYVAFAGRMSYEKGVHTLLNAAKKLPGIPFRLAGGGPLTSALKKIAPPNAQFVGQLDGNEIKQFYTDARLLVLPSECYEMCPLVISEAMSHGLPVVASNIGGIPELVEDGQTGYLFEPGSSDHLKDRIQRLWDYPRRCRTLGKNGRLKAVSQFGENVYYRKLAAIYNEAIGSTVF
jgi:glycosyltransferase involved in cell wall biosynthesis